MMDETVQQSISVTEISDAEITSRDFVKPSYPEKDSEFRFELPSKESLFEARQAAIAQEKIKSGEAPMLYSCGICGEGYKSPKAHEQHLKSKSHIVKASSLETSNGEEDTKIIKQLPPRRVEKNDPAQLKGGSDLKYDTRRDLDDVGATCVGVNPLNKLPDSKLDSKNVGV